MTPQTIEKELRDAATLDDHLDEIRRARMWAELAPGRAAVGVGAGAGTGAGAGSRRRKTVVAVTVIGVAVAAAVIGAVVAARMLWPEGTVGTRAAVKQVFEVPASATARAQLGAAAVTLHGPARMQVARADEVIDVLLEKGSVSGEYDGKRGGVMRVRTPHAVVEVVGTLFDVEVEEGATCVAVAHGAVRVRAGRAVRMVNGGESWCTDAKEVRAVLPAVEERMAMMAIHAAAEPLLEPQPQPDPDPNPSPDRNPNPSPSPDRNPNPSPSPNPIPDPVPSTDSVQAPDPDPVSPADPDPVLAPDVDLYKQAERALQLGDTALADELLAKLVVNHADSELVDDALFERARLAYARAAWGTARASLDQLLEMKSTPLRKPARALLCRIAERTGDRDARRCFDALHREETP